MISTTRTIETAKDLLNRIDELQVWIWTHAGCTDRRMTDRVAALDALNARLDLLGVAE